VTVNIIHANVDEDDGDFVWALLSTIVPDFEVKAKTYHIETSDIESYVSANEATLEADIITNGTVNESLTELLRIDDKAFRWLNGAGDVVASIFYTLFDDFDITCSDDIRLLATDDIRLDAININMVADSVSGGVTSLDGGNVEIRNGNPLLFVESGGLGDAWALQFEYDDDDRFRLLSPSANEFAFHDDGSIGEAWTAATLNSGGNWSNFGGDHNVVAYKKFGDLVYVRGLAVRSSGTNDTVTTLPVGYRPPKHNVYAQIKYDGSSYETVRVDVRNNGAIRMLSGSSTVNFLSLDGIVFSTE